MIFFATAHLLTRSETRKYTENSVIPWQSFTLLVSLGISKIVSGTDLAKNTKFEMLTEIIIQLKNKTLHLPYFRKEIQVCRPHADPQNEERKIVSPQLK